MRTALFLLMITSCSIEIVEPCTEYELTEHQDAINVKIFSESKYTTVKYLNGDQWIELIVNKDYYDCIRISRTETPMTFEINRCTTKI